MKRFGRQKGIRKLDLCCHTDLFEAQNAALGTVAWVRLPLIMMRKHHDVFPSMRKLRNTQDDVENRPPAMVDSLNLLPEKLPD
jgi:hypothetical protein